MASLISRCATFIKALVQASVALSRKLPTVISHIAHLTRALLNLSKSISKWLSIWLYRAVVLVLRTSGRCLGWLWRILRIGPMLAQASAFVLKMVLKTLKWGAIGTAILASIPIARMLGSALIDWHNNRRHTLGQGRRFQNYYGTTHVGVRWADSFYDIFATYLPTPWRDPRNGFHTGRSRQAAEEEASRIEAAAAERARLRREAEAAERERSRREEEAAREKRRRDAEVAVAIAERRELETRANAFESWMQKSETMLRDRTNIRLLPQPDIRMLCKDPTCTARMESLRITCCTHSMKQLVDAYVKVKHLSEERKRGLLKSQKKTWHPDRFTRCPEEARERIQRVAEEFMKIMGGLL